MSKRGGRIIFKLSRYATVGNGSKGALSYARNAGNSKIAVAAKGGALTIPKTLKPGNYTYVVKVTSATTANYKAGSKTAPVYLKVS